MYSDCIMETHFSAIRNMLIVIQSGYQYLANQIVINMAVKMSLKCIPVYVLMKWLNNIFYPWWALGN